MLDVDILNFRDLVSSRYTDEYMEVPFDVSRGDKNTIYLILSNVHLTEEIRADSRLSSSARAVLCFPIGRRDVMLLLENKDKKTVMDVTGKCEGLCFLFVC